MLNLTENSVYNSKKLNKLLNLNTRGYYNMDMDMIHQDINKFQALADKETTKIKKKGYLDIVQYLKGLLQQVNPITKTLKATWCVVNDRIIIRPYQLQNMYWLGLDTTNYICKRDDRTVRISYKDLWNLIAFQLGHRDLFYETKEVDTLLREHGSTLYGVTSPKLLYNLTLPNAYNELIDLRISDTPSSLGDENDIQFYTYFQKPIETDTYKELLTKSIDYAMLVILEDTLEQLPEDKNIELLGILEDAIYYNTDMTNEEVQKYLGRSLLIRVLGRKFEVLPNIELY